MNTRSIKNRGSCWEAFLNPILYMKSSKSIHKLIVFAAWIFLYNEIIK